MKENMGIRWNRGWYQLTCFVPYSKWVPGQRWHCIHTIMRSSMRPNGYAWRSTYGTDICERIFTCRLYDALGWCCFIALRLHSVAVCVPTHCYAMCWFMPTASGLPRPLPPPSPCMKWLLVSFKRNCRSGRIFSLTRQCLNGDSVLSAIRPAL